MSMEMMEKRVYPCKKATDEEISRAIRWISYGLKEETKKLRDMTCPVSGAEIPWDTATHIGILGSGFPGCDAALKEAGMKPGVYTNRLGTWLILIHPEAADTQNTVDRCAGRLISLEALNTSIPELDVSACPLLEELRVWDDKRLLRISGLEGLGQLTELDLSGCSGLRELPGLERLERLTILDLSGCRGLRELPGLERLEGLSKLDLSRCSGLMELPSLEGLKQLTELTLLECSGLMGLSGLERLERLTTLDLSGCSGLRELPGLERLERLTYLYLSRCSGLRELPGPERLERLTKLDLSGCSGLRELPEGIRELKSLRMLDLDGMILKTLPDWLPEIAEDFEIEDSWIDPGKQKANVSLRGTTVEDMEDMSIFEQPYEVVAEWFKNRALGRTRPLNEIKVVFLGDGEAGKSHTIARLMNDGGDPKGYVNVRTPGIVIKDLKHSIGNREATLHLWDFGGQDIMHSMHRIFLTKRTIYVVLVDGSIGNQDERARYWLQNIQSFAEGAPVVLVLNKLDDGLQADVNAVDLCNKYKGLKRIVKLSALQYSKERFNKALTEVLLEEIEKTGYLDTQWPESWVRVKTELEQMKENYIRGDAYLKICEDCAVDQQQKPLLDWFHDLGISFRYCDDQNRALEDYVVLKPNWITNALYIILFNERENGKGGLVPVDTIRKMLSRNAPNRDAIKRVIPDAFYAGYEVNYVLDVFHVFQLSFPEEGGYEFFPMLADINARPVAEEYAKDKDCLEFNMEFDYLPSNLLHRLMVDRHGELDMDNVWRTGAKFRLEELGLTAVVVIDGNTLRFFIRDDDKAHRPNTYLTMLKANVDRIVRKMGIKAPVCKLIYKLDGKRDEFDYEELKMLREIGQDKALAKSHRRMISIEAILNQSAPEGLEDEQKLLAAIRKSCLNIQGDMRYRGSEEDDRNTRIRDDLRNIGYVVHDQTRQGITASGKRPGELDLDIRRENNEPWTIVESLRCGSKSNWNEHLEKLLDRYNAHGLRSLFLIAFVDCKKESFQRIWKSYRDDHIQGHDAGRFAYVKGSFRELPEASAQLIKIASSQYDCGGSRYTVYHIFLQMEPK